MTNMRRLAVHKMSIDAVPKGGGVADAVRFLMDKEAMLTAARNAEAWAKAAVQAVRDASAPNPWRNADDEAIAGEILRRLDERKEKTK